MYFRRGNQSHSGTVVRRWFLAFFHILMENKSGSNGHSSGTLVAYFMGMYLVGNQSHGYSLFMTSSMIFP